MYIKPPNYTRKAKSMTAVQHGDWCVFVISLQYYSSGVYSNSRCSSTDITHAMVLTGYGTYNGKDYYLVKNRWDGILWPWMLGMYIPLIISISLVLVLEQTGEWMATFWWPGISTTSVELLLMPPTPPFEDTKRDKMKLVWIFVRLVMINSRYYISMN